VSTLGSTEVIRILLVEDNPGDARLLRETLRDGCVWPYDVEHVDRLGPALERLQSGDAADVVLLDLSLPDAHGLDTVRRTLEAAPEVPIIVLTGLSDDALALEAVHAGAQDYLVKGEAAGDVLARAILYAIQRKALERERAQLLERERAARAEAEAAVRARDEVLRIVSHDIGNSLTAVGIHAMLLGRAAGRADLEEQVRNRAESIRDLVQQMHHLRQDLLDVASIEAGRLAMEPRAESAGAIARAALETSADVAHERALRLESTVAADLPLVMADRERVLQVLGNLIGNAIKFTPAGGEVRLDVEADDGMVRFSVSDSGPGVADAEREHVFDRFWTGRRGEGSGAGLGLAIARGIVEAHGGRIHVEAAGFDTVHGGARFVFTIPAAPAPVPADDR
jgi:signal transduction histidine kinase